MKQNLRETDAGFAKWLIENESKYSKGQYITDEDLYRVYLINTAMTPKPICVIYFPDNYGAPPNRQWIYEYMAFLNGEKYNGNHTFIGDPSKWADYHWFCFYKPEIWEPELKVFHPKDFTPVQYEELKALILAEIEKIKPEKPLTSL